MAVLQFGDSDSALFGVLTPPVGLDRNHGILMCPPIGQEHIRSHWAYRQVSAALCRAGYYCFRFDWYGVGDSAGELRDATVDRWKADVESAAQELRDTTGVSQISLIGLRLGATIAALAADEVTAAAIVLWDPVVRGSDYIAELRAMTSELLHDRRRYWNIDPDRRIRPSEIMGCDLGERLIGEIERLDLTTQAMREVPTCVLISSHDPNIESLGTQLAAKHREVDLRRTDLRSLWTATDEIETLLLPGDALRSITSFFESFEAR